ncbi:hypothetical protein cypCar_00046394 [Cyprinus carpio]|nr:hypothetical protein cypCar_00046394 [Cyprinus carpio]
MSAVKVMLWICVCICVILTAKAQDITAIRDQNNNLAKQIEVQSMRVDCKVASRFAHTVMTTKAFNTANASQEVFFEVDLPKTAFITNFSIEIEGRIYVSEVKEKEKARHQYESAVSSGQTAGLVKASGRNMEKFSVSVNIAPQSHVTFTLTYEELLQRRLGSYEIMIGVRPKQLVQNFEIVVDIYEPKGIAFVDVNGTFITNELLPLVKKTVTDKKTREALMTILSELHEDDYFGLVTFDDIIELWRPFLSKATPENVTEAKGFVKTIKARHSQLDLSKIQENVQNAINGSMSLFCLGFGYDVDYSLLDTLAKQNDGLARRVYEASDAALQLQGFYDEVATPLLLEVNLNYPGNAVTDLTQSHFRQFFKGSEIVVAGRLQELETNTFQTEVSANGLGDQFLVEGLVIAEEWDSVFPDQEYIFGDFTERLWAYLTIQQLLDERFDFEHNPPSFAFSSMDLQVIKDRSLTVTLRNSVKFLIILHKIWKMHPYHQDYLGFYTLDSHLFSSNVHGLLGKDPDKQDANMFVKGNKLTVTRGWKRDFRQDVRNGENVPCWFIHNNGTGLLDGVHTDYIVSGLFKTT